jgi:hypothetical protein
MFPRALQESQNNLRNNHIAVNSSSKYFWTVYLIISNYKPLQYKDNYRIQLCDFLNCVLVVFKVVLGPQR